MKIHNVNGFLILCRFLSFTHKRKFGEVRSCVLERATPGSSYTHTHIILFFPDLFFLSSLYYFLTYCKLYFTHLFCLLSVSTKNVNSI